MKKFYSYLGMMALFFVISTLNAQVFVIEDFDTTFPAGWTTGGENSSGVPQTGGFIQTTTQACDVGSVRGNAYGTIPIRWLQSIPQTTNGGDIIVSFEYKIVDFSAATNPTPANFGTAALQYSINGGANWVTYHTIDDTNHTPSNVCETLTHTITGLPASSSFDWRIIVTQANGDYYFYVDTFSAIELADCFDPVNFQAMATSSSQAEVSWDSVVPDAIQWNIEYGISGFTPGTGTTVVSTANPYLISGLTAVTEYDVYIQADCGAGVFSGWVGPVTFETWPDCANFTLSVTATDGAVCYEGSATLTVTSSGSGNGIFWYDTATGGNLVGIGSPFETPFIDETTSFWAAEVVHGGNLTGQGFANPTTFSNSTSNAGGLLFTVTNPIIIVDVEVFSTNANSGDITIELRDVDNDNVTIASTVASITGGGTAGSPIPQVVTLNFAVPAAGNYRLVRSAATATVGMGNVTSANSNFPYPLGSSGQITGGSTLISTSVTHFFFYNWTIIEIAFCESTRDEAVATVYDFIPVEAGATQTSINPSDSTTLNAISTNANYDYVWTWDGGTPLVGQNVIVSPTDHTTYTVTATDNVTGCVATDEITILVFNTALCNDLDITSVDGAYICDEGTATLSVTPAGISGNEVYWYDSAIGGDWIATGATFETPVLTETTTYWVSEVLLQVTPLAGQAFANPTVFTNSTSNSNGLLFTVTSPINIVDVEVFGTNATGGDITIELRDIANGNAIIASTTATITGGGSVGTPISHIIPLNFAVPAAGNYRLVRSGASPTGVGMGYVTAANSDFPYPLGTSGEVTGGSSLTSTSTFQYYFFNWTIEEFLFLCESPREEVIATVVETIAVEASATQTSINPGGSTTLNATSTNPNYDYEWTWDGGGPSVGPSVVVSPMSYTTYTVTATDPITGCVATDEITILVFDTTLCNDLDITTVTGGYVCDEGTTILSATAAGITGDDIYWYDSEFDGILLGMGATFETPFIDETTSYWAAEILLGPGIVNGQGKLTPTTTSGYGLTAGLFFEAFDAFTIIDVEAFSASANAGVITSIQLQDGSGTLIAGQEVTNVPVPGGGTGAAPVPFTITLNFDVPGPGLYRLLLVGSTPSLIRDSGAAAAGSFPKPLGEAAEITGSVLGTAAPTTTTYYFFYNWTVTGDMVYCESSREEVIATVVDIVEVEAIATQTSIDPNTSTTLTAISTNTNYEYTWEPASSIAGSNVGTSVTTTALTDHTTFTVTAVDQITNCVATDEITILVFDTTLCNPLDITATTGDTICVGETANLSATANGTGSVIYWYDEEFDGNRVGVGTAFETPVLTSTTSFWAAEVLLEANYIAPIEAAYTSGGLTFFDATNGTGITFAVENTNAQEVKMSQLDFYMPANTSFTFELWYHPTNITGSPGIISAANGWIQIAGNEFVTSGPTNGIYNAFSNLSFEIPATTTYRFILIGTGAGSQFTYVNDAGAPNMFSSGGVNLLVGNNSAGATGNVGYSGTNPLGTSIGTNPRYFYGTIDFNVELCESDRTEAIATVTSDDAPMGDANQDYLAGDTLADLNVTGTDLTWYEDAAGTIELLDSTPLVDGTTYYVSQTVNGCESQLLAVTVTLTVIQPCDPPTVLTLGAVTETTASVSWTASPDETGGYNWLLMESGDDPLTDLPVDFGSVGTGVTTVGLTGLDDDTTYDFYVQTECTGDESSWAGPLNFTTDAFVCDPPTALTIVNVTATTAEVSWTASATATGGYAWYLFADGDNPLTDPSLFDGTVAAGVTTVTVSGLTAATEYDVYVSSLCNAGVESALAGPLNVLTDVAPVGPANDECADAIMLTVGTNFADQQVVGTNENATNDPNDPPPSCDNTNFATNGKDVWYTVVVPISGSITVETRSNGDPGMNDTGLQIYSGLCGAIVSIECNADDGIGNFSIIELTNQTPGQTLLVRVWGWNLHEGEFLISAYDSTECEAPSALTIDNVTDTTINFSWTLPTDISNVDGYFWRLMNSGDNPLVDTPVDDDYVPGATSTSAMISGLSAVTDYDLYLVTVCDEISEFISDPIMIAVSTVAFVCQMPTDVALVGIPGVDSAEISWTASPTETNGYEWAVFNTGDDPLVDPAFESGSVASGVTSVVVTGLNEETTYDFYVRTDCDPDGMSDWEGPFTFTTDDGASADDFGINSIAFYPNPTVDVVNITAQVEIEKVVIFNLLGQKLVEQQVGNTETQIDVSSFASGPYLMQVTTSSGQTGIYRLIKK